MMKSLRYIAIWSLLLTFVGCNNVSVDEDFGVVAEGEGTLSLSISLPESRAVSTEESAEMLENSVLRIYDTSGDEDRLVRRYEPATEMPEEIYMVEGEYLVTLFVGSQIEVSDDPDDVSYYGEVDFSISSGEEILVELVCTLRNTMVEVVFDESIDENLMEGYSFIVYSGDSYDESTVKMTYNESGVGYFILDGEESETLTWKFAGSRESSQGVEEVTKSGVITATAAQDYNTLSFAYSYYLEVTSLTVSVDSDTDVYNDSMNFKPQPQITPLNFSVDGESIYPSYDMELSISALQDIDRVEIEAGEIIVLPFDGGVMSVDGATYEVYDTSSGLLTLSPSLFESYAFGGDQSATLMVYDVAGSSAGLIIPVRVSGITTLSNCDYWANTATLSALLLEDPEDSSIEVDYREEGTSVWYTAEATAGEDDTYNFSLVPTWGEAEVNSYGYDTYKLLFGISPLRSYEYRLRVGEREFPTATITIEDGAQLIPEGTLPAGLDAYGSDICSSSTTWASGNNSYATTLCTYSYRGNMFCAQLSSAMAGAFGVTKLASGNIIYGQFDFGYTSGTVSFGQSFDWSARPRSLKVDYASSIGVIGSESGQGLSSGDDDPAYIFMAIVDWSSRRDVTAGTSSTSGIWHPEDRDSTSSEGDIIGCAYMLIEESTVSDGMESIEIECYYFDKETKPSKSISLVIAAASSAYGDYFVGSTDSKLWVQNFEFGY